MSTRSSIRPHQVIPSPQASPPNSGSMGANITSEPTILQSITLVGYSVSWTGSTPVGALSVEVSNDYSINADGSVNNAGTWSTVTLSVNGSPASSVAVTGNTGSGFINVDKIGSYAIRLKYTRTSGTGTMNAIVVGKVS